MRIVSRQQVLFQITLITVLLGAVGYLAGEEFGYIFHGIYWADFGILGAYFGGNKVKAVTAP